MSMRNGCMTLRTIVEIFTFLAFVSCADNWTDITSITEDVVMLGLWFRHSLSNQFIWFFLWFCWRGLRGKIFHDLLTLNLYSLFNHLAHRYFLCIFISLYFLLFWFFSFLLFFIHFLLLFCLLLQNFSRRNFGNLRENVIWIRIWRSSLIFTHFFFLNLLTLHDFSFKDHFRLFIRIFFGWRSNIRSNVQFKVSLTSISSPIISCIQVIIIWNNNFIALVIFITDSNSTLCHAFIKLLFSAANLHGDHSSKLIKCLRNIAYSFYCLFACNFDTQLLVHRGLWSERTWWHRIEIKHRRTDFLLTKHYFKNFIVINQLFIYPYILF